MEEVQFEVLAHKINEVDEKLSRVDRDMANDRNNMDQFKVELAAVKEQQRQLLDRQTKMETRIKDGIRDAVLEAVAPMQRQLDEFTSKKVVTRTININPLVQWWKRIRG